MDSTVELQFKQMDPNPGGTHQAIKASSLGKGQTFKPL